MNDQNLVSIATYGGVINVFFARIYNANRNSASIGGFDDPSTISLKRVIDQRRKTPFPEVTDVNGRHKEKVSEANKFIRILNRTEDITVFRIAVNALLLLIQGNVGYCPLFDRKDYPPNQLQKALEEVEEVNLA